MRDEEHPPDYLDKARTFAVVGLLVAALLAIAGSLLDWVHIVPPDVVPEREAANIEPFTGVEAQDGLWVISGALLLGASAVGLLIRRKGSYALAAFLVSIVIGAIAVADYRGVGEVSSAISQRMNIVGDATAGIGLKLVALAALLGLISSIIGLAATPKTARD
jgi:hypothetical protein